MKKDVEFVCNECGFISAKWIGKCPECFSWDITETKISTVKQKVKKNVEIFSLSDVNISDLTRYQSSFKEFDRVIGGGFVKGSVFLLTGSPGIGKSTLILQLLDSYVKYGNLLYVTGEESVYQIKQRSTRLKIKNENIKVISEIDIDNIIFSITKTNSKIVVIDSIQTLRSSESNSIVGSINQIRECCFRLVNMAKKSDISVIIIGHVTKDGKIAGPKLLEHMVDAVFEFEGAQNSEYRIIRSIKNRYGPSNEIGIFEMKADGIFEVNNISDYFLGDREEENIGSSVSAVLKGNKVFVIEIQSLTSKTHFGLPRRIIQGTDFNKSQLIISVLEKKINVNCGIEDIFINIPGGISVKDPSIDLAVAVSIISSIKNININKFVAFIGEIGLRGEIRKVSYIEKRVIELEKLGFTKIYVPYGNKKELVNKNFEIKIYYLNNINEVIKAL